jgi:alkylated DNA repair protein (DNA oxidative demethylase)
MGGDWATLAFDSKADSQVAACQRKIFLSLGLSAIFLFGGQTRKERPRRIRLENGDVVVWGGPARLAFHGVGPLADGDHPLTGRCRINLTLRVAL